MESGQSIQGYDYLYKLCFLGSMSVGKSCLCARFGGFTFPKDSRSTIGATFMTSKVGTETDGQCIVKLEIWDTAGQEKFKSLTPMYYRGAHGVFIVYDVTNRNTYDEAKEYVSTVRAKAEKPELVSILLLGNKVDLIGSDDNYVHSDEAKKFCEENDICFFEVSAQSGYNLGPAIKGLLTGKADWEDKNKPGSIGRAPKRKKNGEDDGELEIAQLTENPEVSTLNEARIIWWFEDVNAEECTDGLLGKQRKEGFKGRYDGTSYRSYQSAPILDAMGDNKVDLKADSDRDEPQSGKKGCCGGNK